MSEVDERAVFVDRDGVVNCLAPDPESNLPESPTSLEEVELLPGVAEALVRLGDAGYLLVCVTNQPAAAKGKASVAELQAIQKKIDALLEANGARFDLVEMCLHHPSGIVAELSRHCDCRKPAPGMLRRAASQLGVNLARSWMIGDSETDIEAGLRAGCRTILVEHAASHHRRRPRSAAEAIVGDLGAAVDVIVSKEDDC